MYSEYETKVGNSNYVIIFHPHVRVTWHRAYTLPFLLLKYQIYVIFIKDMKHDNAMGLTCNKLKRFQQNLAFRVKRGLGLGLGRFYMF